MNNVLDNLIVAMNDLLGFPEDEIRADLDLNLFEKGLLDSLAVVTLISNIDRYIGYQVDLKKMSTKDFRSVSSMAAALEKQKEINLDTQK